MVNLQQLPTVSDTPKNESFIRRHIGISDEAAAKMLEFLGFESLEDLISKTVPDGIRQKLELNLPHARTEVQSLKD